jgi:hypothetical protein
VGLVVHVSRLEAFLQEQSPTQAAILMCVGGSSKRKVCWQSDASIHWQGPSPKIEILYDSKASVLLEVRFSTHAVTELAKKKDGISSTRKELLSTFLAVLSERNIFDDKKEEEETARKHKEQQDEQERVANELLVALEMERLRRGVEEAEVLVGVELARREEEKTRAEEDRQKEEDEKRALEIEGDRIIEWERERAREEELMRDVKSEKSMEGEEDADILGIGRNADRATVSKRTQVRRKG